MMLELIPIGERGYRTCFFCGTNLSVKYVVPLRILNNEMSI